MNISSDASPILDAGRNEAKQRVLIFHGEIQNG